MRDLNEILSEQPHTPAQLNELLSGIPLAELIDQPGQQRQFFRYNGTLFEEDFVRG